MHFVDFHTHIYPEKIAVRATEALSSFFKKESGWPGTGENLEIFGKAAGIDKFVVLPVAIKSEQVRKINEFVIGQAHEYPDFIPFGSLHASMDGLVEEVEFLHQQGFQGVKIHPDQQQFALNDERMFPAYDYMSEIGMPILFHCGDLHSDLSHPWRTKKLIQEFPKLKIVAAHFGGWTIFDEAYEILRKEQIHFDMSSTMYAIGLEKTGKFIKAYGAEKIFFGTDFPLCDQKVEKDNFLSLNITDVEKELIAYKNAEDFLGIKI